MRGKTRDTHWIGFWLAPWLLAVAAAAQEPEPPIVSLTVSPSSGLVAPAIVTLSASAFDPRGSIRHVEFYDGSALLARDALSPYSYVWSGVAAGTHVVTARAIDNDNMVGEASELVTVSGAGVPPTGNMTTNSPCALPGPDAPDRCRVTVTWSSVNAPVTCIWTGTSLFSCEGLSQSQVAYPWVSAGGSTLQLRAHGVFPTLDPRWPADIPGILGTSTLLDQEFVQAVAGNVPPTVTVSATPATGLVAPASTRLEASAADPDGVVVRVDFRDGGALLASALSQPWTFEWNGIPAGPHPVTATAVDDDGASTASAVLPLVVAPPTPACTIALPLGGDIQAALNALAAPATLCLTPGAAGYWVGTTVVVPANVTIRGAGGAPQDTIVRATGGLVGPVFRTAFGATGTTFENMTVTSNGAQQNDLDAVTLSIVDATNVTVRGIRASNTWRMGMVVARSSGVTVADSSFSTMGFAPQAQGAIWINASSRVVFERNNVVGRANGPGGDGGVDCYESTNVVIRDNTISQTGESAIYTTLDAAPNSSACRDVVISGNTVLNSEEWGIDTRGLNGALITQNRVEGSAFGAMSIWDAANTRVTNNVMRSNNRRRSKGCQGINRAGYQINNTFTGNSGTGTLLCTFHP